MPKLKNSACFGDLIGGQRAARHFNHRADQVIEFHFFRGLNFLRDAMHDLDLQVEFLRLKPTSGIMISGFTLIPLFCTSAAASKIARACISRYFG